jgi:gas vesicle protein
MKIPFKSNNNQALIITAVTLVTAAAGALAYLFATKSGKETREQLQDAVEEGSEHAQDYLEAKTHHLKKKKTDLHELEDLVKNH